MVNLDSHAYTILSSSRNKVFLHINHEGAYSKFGKIYMSDSTGLNYVESINY